MRVPCPSCPYEGHVHFAHNNRPKTTCPHFPVRRLFRCSGTRNNVRNGFNLLKRMRFVCKSALYGNVCRVPSSRFQRQEHRKLGRFWVTRDQHLLSPLCVYQVAKAIRLEHNRVSRPQEANHLVSRTFLYYCGCCAGSRCAFPKYN